jgi:hypothetical protein
MPRDIKPIPKNAEQISQEQISPYLTNEGKPISETSFTRNRAEDISMKGDKVKDVSIGLEDIDNAVMYYFTNVIKPTVIQNSQRIAVPVIYGSPERWKSVQADGFYRDNSGRLMVPLIMFKRESFEKDRSLGNKLDGNKVHNYQVIGTKYNSRNQYDKFSVLNNRIPSEQYYVTTVPDYLTLTYNCIIFTDFVEQNNKLVEAVQFASDTYWGDPSRWKFRARIDTFTTTTLLEEGTDRAAKSTFSITLNGYIIPDTVNKDLAVARSKFYTKSQVIFDLEVVDGSSKTTDIETMKFANKAPAQNAGGSTSFVGGGINVTNNNITISSAAAGDLAYLNTNKTLQATTVTVPNTAVFTGAILQPPAGSTLPSTTVNNFVFYINGQYVPSALVTLTPGSGIVTAVFNTTSLGYTLEADDEVIAIGKWQ